MLTEIERQVESLRTVHAFLVVADGVGQLERDRAPVRRYRAAAQQRYGRNAGGVTSRGNRPPPGDRKSPLKAGSAGNMVSSHEIGIGSAGSVLVGGVRVA